MVRRFYPIRWGYKGGTEEVAMHIHTIGVDLGKTVFHLVGLSLRGEVVVHRKFSRTQLLQFTANVQVDLIGMEACAGAHFLGRALREQGHEVRIIPAQYVKPYVKTNKSDFIANYNRSYYGQVYENDPARYTAAVGSTASLVNTNRLNPQFTSINVRGADGDSYYDGLNLKVTGSNLFDQGLTVTSNYTYAHSTDNTSSTFTDGQANGDVGGVAYFDPYNHGLDHGNSDFDVRHRISVSTIWAIPYAKDTHGLVRSALDGWEIGTIFSANTGTPFTMYDCGVSFVTACGRVRFTQPQPFQRTGNSIATTTPDIFQYITFPTFPGGSASAAARAAAGYGTYLDPKVGAADLPTIVNGIDTFPGGMTARNAFRGPGVWNLNADVNKNIRFTERLSVQLRAEAYNLFNHANSYLNLSGANDVNNTSYAQIYKNQGYNTGDNRQLQLAAKFIF